MDTKQAAREKTWDEMTDAERIGKLRSELRYALGELASMRDTLSDLERHSHGALGQLLKPIVSSSIDRPHGYRRRDPLA